MTKRREKWATKYGRIVRDLGQIRDRIDGLGTAGDDLIFADCVGGPEDRDPDTIACYASNSIEGTLALLRDLYQRVINQGNPKA